jgi:hypothetical protein
VTVLVLDDDFVAMFNDIGDSISAPPTAVFVSEHNEHKTTTRFVLSQVVDSLTCIAHKPYGLYSWKQATNKPIQNQMT